MDKKNTSKHTQNSSASKTLDKFLEACLNVDNDDFPDLTSDIPLPSQEESKKQPAENRSEEEIPSKSVAAWNKVQDLYKEGFKDINSRIGEILKGLHDNSKISELAVEILTVETVRQIISGKIRDFKGNEATINIHPRAAKLYWDKLKVGSVIMLKNVTVYSPSTHTHCLIVLKDNILNVFTL